MTETVKVSWNLPNILTDQISDIDGTPIPLPFNAYSAAGTFPNRLWIEQDVEGVNHLCTTSIVGAPLPLLSYNVPVITIKALPFELFAIEKTAGDRGWHPGSRPRPLS